MKIEKKLENILKEIFKIKKKINLKITIENEKNWDSINHMKLMIALEEEFKIKIPTIEQQNLISFEIITNFIKKRIKGK